VRWATEEHTILSLWSHRQLHQVATGPPPTSELPGVPLTLIDGKLSDGGHVVVRDPSALGNPDTCPVTSFLWHHGHRQEIGAFNAAEVNRRGQVVGGACEVVDGTPSTYAAVWEDGGSTRLPGLDGTATNISRPIYVRDLNNRGQIVYHDYVADGPGGGNRRHTVLWEAGRVTDIGTGIGGTNRPIAINDRGQVLMEGFPEVGGTVGFFGSGFLWDRGSLVDLIPEDDHPVLIWLHAMNDRGHVVGRVSYLSGGPSGTKLWQVRHVRP
jgi:uncharacterized membrane protein